MMFSLRLVSLKFAKYIKYWHKWNTDDRIVSKEKEGCVSIYSENIVMVYRKNVCMSGEHIIHRIKLHTLTTNLEGWKRYTNSHTK